jgi:hypothetical protein
MTTNEEYVNLIEPYILSAERELEEETSKFGGLEKHT